MSERLVTHPMDLVFVRHGQSEANIVQHAEKEGIESEWEDRIYERHDFEHPLSALGVQQAKAARAMLISLGLAPDSFDAHYVSPFLRTVETAAFIGEADVNWKQDWRLAERDWGIYGATPMNQRIERFAETERRSETSSFFTRYDGGENMPDVLMRFRDWLGTQNREMTNGRVLTVTHGEFMWGVRYLLEGLTPDEWQRMDKDKSLRIANCCIAHYTRRNPDNPAEVVSNFSNGWARMIDPYEPERSPYDGEWRKLHGRTLLIGAEILAAAKSRERIGEITNRPSNLWGRIRRFWRSVQNWLR